MTQDKEKIIERIKKLIALSEDNSTTEGERTACREKAKKLMIQFSIDSYSEATAEPPQIVTEEFIFEKKIFGLGVQSLCSILSAIGPSFGCYSFYSAKLDKNYVMGFKINCEITIYTATVLINQGVRDCSSVWQTIPSANTKLAFWKGFIHGLHERYQPQSPAVETGVVLYDKVREEFLARTQFTTSFLLGSSGEALQAGKKSAMEARVSSGLNSSQGGTKLVS